MKDKVEIFSEKAHLIADTEKHVDAFIAKYTETPLETLAEVTTVCLREMDNFLLSKEEETEETANKYLRDLAILANVSMAGYCYALGIEPNLTRVANQMVDTYKRKNADYGDSFGDSINHYGPVAAHVRIGDKINRLQSLVLKKQTAQVKDESIADTYLDLACYAIMTLADIEYKAQFAEEEEK